MDSTMTQNTIAELEAVRLKLCPYAGPTCDCKDGVDTDPYSEHTGCPEIRHAIALLRWYEARDQRIIEATREMVEVVRALL